MGEGHSPSLEAFALAFFCYTFLNEDATVGPVFCWTDLHCLWPSYALQDIGFPWSQQRIWTVVCPPLVASHLVIVTTKHTPTQLQNDSCGLGCSSTIFNIIHPTSFRSLLRGHLHMKLPLTSVSQMGNSHMPLGTLHSLLTMLFFCHSPCHHLVYNFCFFIFCPHSPAIIIGA